jgi:hypothetical protein
MLRRYERGPTRRDAPGTSRAAGTTRSCGTGVERAPVACGGSPAPRSATRPASGPSAPNTASRSIGRLSTTTSLWRARLTTSHSTINWSWARLEVLLLRAAPISAAEGLLASRTGLTPKRVAAEFLLGAGELERGTEALSIAFAQAGLRWRSHFGSILDVAVQRLVLAASGFPRRASGLQLRLDATHVRDERLELLWTAAFALAAFDPLRAVALQARHARMAMQLGNLPGLVRSLATELVLLAAGRNEARVPGARSERSGSPPRPPTRR